MALAMKELLAPEFLAPAAAAAREFRTRTE